MTKAAQELWEIVSKTELNALIEAANGYLDGDYTTESLAALQAAITAAQTVAINDDATTAEVTQAITDLSDAITNLETITLDTSALEHEIELVSEMIANLDNYVPSSVEGLQEKLDAAKTALSNATTQEEIDEATKTLREARLNARTKADTSALEELIAYINNLDLSAYTKESAQAVIQKLARAENVVNDPEVTQAEVDNMVKDLQASVDNLVSRTAQVLRIRRTLQQLHRPDCLPACWPQPQALCTSRGRDAAKRANNDDEGILMSALFLMGSMRMTKIDAK